MGILLGLSPFIVFFVLLRLASPLAGLAAAFIASLLLGALMWRRGESVKVLEVGSFVLFGALTLFDVVVAPAWTVASVRLAVDAGLLIIVLTSLAIGRPFTLQYAREQVAREFWTTPLFVRANRLITAVWAAAFAVLVAADAAAEWVPAAPLWVGVLASVLALIGAFWFTLWYPGVARRRALPAGPAAT